MKGFAVSVIFINVVGTVRKTSVAIFSSKLSVQATGLKLEMKELHNYSFICATNS